MRARLTRGEQDILDYLRLQPLPMVDYWKLSSSPESLKVRILRMRDKGVRIITLREKNLDNQGRAGTYVLLDVLPPVS